MSARRSELTRAAARLFAEKGYHGTSIGDLAEAMGVQKGSLYAHSESKADLLWEVAREGAAAFHSALDAVPDEGPIVERIRAALRAHLRVVAEQLDVATVFVREWRYLQGERREEFVAERRRYEERFRALFRDGRELGELRTDLDDATAALLGLESDVPIGFLPGGGESVLPRALGLPRDPVRAARQVADALAVGRSRRISLGRVNGRRFGFGAGIGLPAEVVRRVDALGRR